MSPTKLRHCAISVDLDEIYNYHAIYGLEPPTGSGACAVYDIAVKRLDAFARANGVPLTFFAVGKDLDREPNARLMCEMCAAGHEVANHSQDHFYDLSRRSSEEIFRQVHDACLAIERATGIPPSGFRAPGYVINDTMVQALKRCGLSYDTSVLPSPPYFAAKAVAMTWIAARGRTSRSVQDHPRVLLAPTQPYRMGRSYWQKGDGLVEIPVQVTRGPRLPFIGTTITMAGPGKAQWLCKLVVGTPVINLELHGIDALDIRDGLERLAPHTPDVRMPVERKLQSLEHTIRILRQEGYDFARLDQLAAQF